MEVLPFEKVYQSHSEEIELLKENFIKEINDYFKNTILSPIVVNIVKNNKNKHYSYKNDIFIKYKIFTIFNYKNVFTLDNGNLVFCEYIKENDNNTFNFNFYKSLQEIDNSFKENCKQYIKENIKKENHIVPFSKFLNNELYFLLDYEFCYEFNVKSFDYKNYLIIMELKNRQISFTKKLIV